MTDNNQTATPQLPTQQPTATNAFSLGMGTAATTNQKKVNPQTAAEVADKRRTEVFGDVNFTESSKRGRTDYAETLRKKRREEHQRAKRQHMNTATPGVSIPSQAQGANATQGFPQQQQAPSLGLQTMISTLNFSQIIAESANTPHDQIIQEGNNMQVTQDNFAEIISLLRSDSLIYQILATIGLRKLMSFEQNPPIQQTVDMNMIPRLLQLSKTVESPKLQFEAIWCLTNIASSDSQFVLKLIENGAIPVLISITESATHLEVKEQTIWCLGNISGDNVRFRDAILDSGVLPKICDLVEQAPAGSSFTRNSVWTLSNLCKGKPCPDFTKVDRAIPTFSKVLSETDQTEILNDICWTLSYITDEGGDERILVFLQSGIVPRLCQLLRHDQMIIAVPCLRTLGNILTARDDYAQAAIDVGVLDAFTQLLDHPKKAIRKEICWSISNVTAGSPQQIQTCIDIGLIDKIINLMSSQSMDIRQEAVWCLSNATAHATPQQIKAMVDKGIIRAIGSVLDSKEARFLIVSLEGLSFIMKCGRDQLVDTNGVNPMIAIVEQCGLLDKLEALQFSKNQQVYQKSADMLEEYFEQEDETNIMEMLAMSAPQQQNMMAPTAPTDSSSLWNNTSETPQQNSFQF